MTHDRMTTPAMRSIAHNGHRREPGRRFVVTPLIMIKRSLRISGPLWAVLLACGGQEQAERSPADDGQANGEHMVLAEFVAEDEALFPHLRYLADGQMTLNDRCPVRKAKLNPKMIAAYVNGRPVGFC